MLPFIFLTLYVASYATGIVLPRQNGDPNPGSDTVDPDPGLQAIPATAKADNTFSNGQDELVGGFPYDKGKAPDLYQPRKIDIPFGRMFHGDLMMFREGQLNKPGFNTDQWSPNQYDFANQSACGIPDNSYLQMKVAIHPYFLKYAGLDRYCMQDVCVSFWPEGEFTNDMIAKVTDICSTDPDDPSHCATPSDIKVDRAKVQVMYNIPVPGEDNADLQKDKYVKGTYWHLTKCWGNALPQPAYRDNWWAKPPLPNNFQWDVDATTQQMKNNQESYPSKGWPTYPDGTSANAESVANIAPINDWVPGQEPSWAPIAGGKGFGTPELSKGPPAGSGIGAAGSASSANVTNNGEEPRPDDDGHASTPAEGTPPSTPGDEEPCSDEDEDGTSAGPTQVTPVTAQPSGAAISKRDSGHRWLLAAGSRTVNGIPYVNPARWGETT